MAAPPCTDFTVSGAQYWEEKDREGKTENSIRLVKKTLEVIDYFDPTFWVLENPVGRLQTLLPELGEPWYFQPYEYGDPWTKKTGLWGKFNKPKIRSRKKPKRFSSQGSWTQLLGGTSETTKELRSITAPNFAKAFFKANSNQENIKTIMERIDHREFIEQNSINRNSLPDALQKKIGLFDKILEKLKHTVDDDTKTLKNRLETLDNELLEDLETEFEDRLDNNDIDEQNDDILEKLYKQGNIIVLKSDLLREGFKGDLDAGFITVGNYCLQRIGTFTYKFKILKFSK